MPAAKVAPASDESIDPVLAHLTTAAPGQAAPAFAWATLSNLIQLLVRFTSTIVLARILAPSDYGLVAVVGSVTVFASLFTDLGLAAAIIHAAVPSRTLLSTAFWINAVTGVALGLLAGATGYLMALVYHEPQLRSLMWLAGLTFVLDLRVVHTALLERLLRFRQIALIETAAMAVNIGVCIAAAELGFGASSLVLGPVVAVVFGSVCVWVVVPWRPGLVLTREAATSIVRYGRGLLGYNVFTYWSRNLDNILLARVTSARELGFYSRSFSLMMAPILQMSEVFGRVLFPTLTRRRDDPRALGETWLRATKLAFLSTLPAALTCATAGPALVVALYGPHWRGAGPILALLGLAAALQMLPVSCSQVYQATGATDELFRRGWRMSACTIVAIVAGLPWGAVGVATGVLANSCLFFWYPVAGVCELTTLPLRRVLGSFRGLLLSGVAFAAASLAVHQWLAADLSDIALVLGQAAAGTAAMLACISVADRQLYSDCKHYGGRALARVRAALTVD